VLAQTGALMGPDYEKWGQDLLAVSLHGMMVHVGERIFSVTNVSVKTSIFDQIIHHHCSWDRTQKTVVLAFVERNSDAENNKF